MRIVLIRPAREERQLRLEDGSGWKPLRTGFNHLSPWKIGVGNALPPLALMAVAALTPDDYEITIVDEEIEKVDFDKPADLVGITLLTKTAKHGYEIADRFRERGVQVVLGGMHATVLPEEAATHADAVVIGEAEGVWHQVLADVRAGKLRQFYRNDTVFDLARLPRPRRDLINSDGYLTTNFIQTTRGCPHRCSFCSIHAVYGTEYRCRPVADVITEVESFPSPGAVFIDDNIVGDPAYAKRLFEAIKPLGIWWFAQATLDIAFNDELLQLAAESGCKCLLIGFESLAAENIKKIGKLRSNDVTRYAEAVDRIHSHGITISGSFIVGLDGDDLDVFSRTAEFVQDNDIELPSIALLTPLPGTRLYKNMVAEGRLLYHDYWRQHFPTFSNALFRPKGMTIEQLEEGYRSALQQVFAMRPITKRLSRALRRLSPGITLPVAAYNLKNRKVLKHELRTVSETQAVTILPEESLVDGEA